MNRARHATSSRSCLASVLAALVLGGMAAWWGDVDDSVSAGAAFEIWGDVLRDVDQFGLVVTRVSPTNEMALGRELARGMPELPESSPWPAYVTAVGEGLVPYVRRQGIRYTFHALPGGQPDADALPGGQVFISEGMLRFLRSEAELAAVLAHEMAHIDQRHCIELFQAVLAGQRAGLGRAGAAAEIVRRVAAVGYRQYQEAEADAVGLRMLAAAGYDPEAAVRPLERLAAATLGAPGRAGRSAREPLGEAVAALARGLGTYGASHPHPLERAERLRHSIARERFWRGPRQVYLGERNHAEQIPRRDHSFADEMISR